MKEELYDRAISWALNQDAISISIIQIDLSLGFNTAKQIFERLKSENIGRLDNKGRLIVIHDYVTI